MRLRALLPLAVLPVAFLLDTGAATAQRATGTCRYDECALRIKAPTLTTPALLVRGTRDEPIVELGLFKPYVEPLVAASDSAARHARAYDVLYDRGAIISIVGTVTAIAAPILFPNTSQKIGFTLVGIGVSVYGGVVTNRANESLSRAIWWYNGQLPRN